jgi:hypothetical protein
MFLKIMRGGPKAKASVWYPPEDVEAYTLADQIVRWLGRGQGNVVGAGWQIVAFEPIPKNARGPGLAYLPSAVRFGFGVAVISSPRSNRQLLPVGLNTPLEVLTEALEKGISGPSLHTDAGLNDDEFIIVVSQKPPVPLTK